MILILTSFVSAPELNTEPVLYKNTSKYAGGFVGISGCQYSFPAILQNTHIYWLKNGVKLEPLSNNIANDSLASLEFLSTDLSHQGNYQCGIFIQGLMDTELLSPIVQVLFTCKNLH